MCVIPFIGITVKIESDDKDCDDDNGILTNEEAIHDQELEGKSEVVLHDQELEGIYDIYDVTGQDLIVLMTFNGNFVLLIDTQSVVSGVNNKI